jgi:hypothetical protein
LDNIQFPDFYDGQGENHYKINDLDKYFIWVKHNSSFKNYVDISTNLSKEMNEWYFEANIYNSVSDAIKDFINHCKIYPKLSISHMDYINNIYLPKLNNSNIYINKDDWIDDRFKFKTLKAYYPTEWDYIYVEDQHLDGDEYLYDRAIFYPVDEIDFHLINLTFLSPFSNIYFLNGKTV